MDQTSVFFLLFFSSYFFFLPYFDSLTYPFFGPRYSKAEAKPGNQASANGSRREKKDRRVGKSCDAHPNVELTLLLKWSKCRSPGLRLCRQRWPPWPDETRSPLSLKGHGAAVERRPRTSRTFLEYVDPGRLILHHSTNVHDQDRKDRSSKPSQDPDLVVCSTIRLERPTRKQTEVDRTFDFHLSSNWARLPTSTCLNPSFETSIGKRRLPYSILDNHSRHFIRLHTPLAPSQARASDDASSIIMPRPRLYPSLRRVLQFGPRPRSLLSPTGCNRRWRQYRLLLQVPASRCQSTIPQRHGTAVEQVPQPQSSKGPPPKAAQDAHKNVKIGRADDAKGGEKGAATQAEVDKSDGDKAAKKSTSPAKKDADTLPDRLERKAAEFDTPTAASGSSPQAIASNNPADQVQTDASPESMALQTISDTHPLETVLHIEPPTASRAEARHKTPPHLEAPPYVHHFDTYTLVKDLSKGGFTEDQSITMMKAVRSLLAVNLDMAKDGLVSKSDVENVSRPSGEPFPREWFQF